MGTTPGFCPLREGEGHPANVRIRACRSRPVCFSPGVTIHRCDYKRCLKSRILESRGSKPGIKRSQHLWRLELGPLKVPSGSRRPGPALARPSGKRCPGAEGSGAAEAARWHGNAVRFPGRRARALRGVLSHVGWPNPGPPLVKPDGIEVLARLLWAGLRLGEGPAPL